MGSQHWVCSVILSVWDRSADFYTSCTTWRILYTAGEGTIIRTSRGWRKVNPVRFLQTTNFILDNVLICGIDWQWDQKHYSKKSLWLVVSVQAVPVFNGYFTSHYSDWILINLLITFAKIMLLFKPLNVKLRMTYYLQGRKQFSLVP